MLYCFRADANMFRLVLYTLIILSGFSCLAQDNFFNFETAPYNEGLTQIVIVPLVESDEGEIKGGIYASGRDVLRKHAIVGRLSYGSVSHKLNGQLDITEKKYRSTFHLRIFERVVPEDYYGYEFQRLRKGIWLDVLVPLSVHNIFGTVISFENFSSVYSEVPATITAPFYGDENKLSFYYEYKNFKQRGPLDIIPYSGKNIRFVYGFSSRSLDSDLTYNEGKFYYEQYFQLTRTDNVVKARIDLARTFEYTRRAGFRFSPESQHLRGLVNDSFEGNSYFAASLDYRHAMPPINQNLLFMYFYKYFLTVFCDAGKWYDSGFYDQDFQYTAGLEAMFKIGLSGRLPAIMKIGAGKEMNKEKNNPKAYFFMEYGF